MTTKFEPVEGGETVLWIQPDGPNSDIYILGCHGMDDIEESFGEIEQLLCRDLSQPNKWKTVKLSQGPPDLIETSITGDLMCETADWLETIGSCAFALYMSIVCCGRLDIFDNFERLFVMEEVRRSTAAITGLNARTEQTRVEQNFGVTIRPPLGRVFRLQSATLQVVSTQVVTDTDFLHDEQCASSCGVARKNCQIGFLTTDDNEVFITTDSGDTFTATAAAPFVALEAVASVSTFIIGRDTRRVVVVRGTTDVGNPAEIAYSDDDGATWTLVNVGATNGQYATLGGSLFSLNRFNMWLVTTGGFIYYSSDAGQVWAIQEAGVITAGDYNAIHFLNSQEGVAVANADVIVRTLDGGGVWAAVTATGTGDNLTTVAVTPQTIWVGTDAGELWYSSDDGVTWSQRTFVGSGTGTVTDIEFVDEYIGFMTHISGAAVGTVHQTVNGGRTWGAITSVPSTSAGYNSVTACASGLLFAGGALVGGAPQVIRLDVPVSSNLGE